MATLEEVVYSRRNNPLTLSLFFRGKDRAVFSMLFGESRWLETQWLDLSRNTSFDFDRVVPMPYAIKERRDKLLSLLQGELDEAKVREFWRLESDKTLPTTTTWNMAKWGVADTTDIHVRYLTRKVKDEYYLQLIFMGLVNLPFALFSELDSIGLKYDAVWINDIEKTYGDYSSPGNDDSAFNDRGGLIYDLDEAYKYIYSVDVVEHVGAKPALLWIRDLLVTTDNALKDFLLKHPLKEWEDNRARIFTPEDQSRQDYLILENLICGVITRNDFLREEIWRAELTAKRLVDKLMGNDPKEFGYLYYNFRRLVDWGLEETNKQLAG